MRPIVDFLLHQWLRVDELAARPRFADHSRETFSQVLNTSERVAREKFAPFNRLVDTEEPAFVDGKVVLPAATQDAWNAYAATGMMAASQDFDAGGMQLPYSVEVAANAFFYKASVGIGYGGLAVGNASLLMAHGTEVQRRVFAAAEFNGRWAGTMCLSEPQAGSSLGDIASAALPDGPDFEGDGLGPRYRLFGNKMWISAGDHELTENIVHLVLAKIRRPDGALTPGVGGLSLFIVPKWVVDDEGRLTGERNDVALAGLNHKCGWRGTTNTLLNFGEGRFRPQGQAGALAYRVGAAGDGLRCMFHMMNEARIGIGLSATTLGIAGYEVSLAYARQRLQGRLQGAGTKDGARPQVAIIEHADVKRMLLAQKAYCEGALALVLYCARLVDEKHSGTAESRAEATLLLELLTPIAKSWPSEWCLEANSLAIQVLGGYGYTRDFPVEQYWRDNRLNMIHEGTHGIQALDLLGRKVVMQGGAGLQLLSNRIQQTVDRARVNGPLLEYSHGLNAAWRSVQTATESAWATGVPQEALANATPYLQAFGHVVLAWIWLELGLTAAAVAANTTDGDTQDRMAGLAAALRYFHAYELPKVGAWLGVVSSREPVCREMKDAWF